MSDVRFFLHALAVELGKTLGELLDLITFDEMVSWSEFYRIREEKQNSPEEIDWSNKEEIAKAFKF